MMSTLKPETAPVKLNLAIGNEEREFHDPFSYALSNAPFLVLLYLYNDHML